MKDLLEGIKNWEGSGKEFCIATVIRTWRSAPQPIGASMLISSNGEMLGSVSGGCVEKNVIVASREVLENGKPLSLTYGVENNDAWRIGLSCGGEIDVIVEKFPAFTSEREKNLWEKLKRKLHNNEEVVWISEIGSDRSFHFLVEPSEKNEEIDDAIYNSAIELLDMGSSAVFESGSKKYFAQVFPKKKQLIMIGSAHITSELLQLAKQHDFETIVIDPRDTFAMKIEHLVKPDQLFVNWPQEVLTDLKPDRNTFAVILSHDPKIDDAALEILLKTNIPYIGALGSVKTHEKRKLRMFDKGFSEEDMSRVHAPIGVRIYAASAKEIALSIMAEMIAVKNSI